jgi:hypothetical protein
MFRTTLRDLGSRALRLVPGASFAGEAGGSILLRRPRPRTVAEHHVNLRAVGCIVTRLPNPVLHYCHDGSMTRIAGSLLNGERNEALVLPLSVQYQSGRSGIDGRLGVLEWERLFGTQASYIDRLSALLGYDVWDLARAWTPSLLRGGPALRVVEARPRVTAERLDI